jgi:hypothetical protein
MRQRHGGGASAEAALFDLIAATRTRRRALYDVIRERWPDPPHAC